ncbi:putative DNA double-strand break repair protein Mre11 [Methanocella paludicola SANAE]|uniref:DNA double-strand break repair protein Mre11 n=2 Tax=Methanocella TaxID=570266 RepID=D1YYH3_METPS|nr:putative DNA double-strand break repair protein Mre11 [Methanocella paludicola SANAE]
MNFIHMADMHLGYRQYGLEERFLDFGYTFKQVVEYAIAQKVEFVLISGDLFDKRSINAPTYIQAVHVLSLLKNAGIPCIAIEGNHDRRFLKDGMSWLDSLEWEGLLKVIKNYDGDLMGGFVDAGKTRIFGLGFAGSMTSAAIPRIKEEIAAINAQSPPERTIFMLHAGVQGKMKYGVVGEVTYEDLCQLKGAVDYLALGHYHSNYEIDDWAYNPGSPDTCSIVEAYEKKGIYHVTDVGAKLVPMSTRKFIPLRIKADGHKGFESLLNDIRESLIKYGKYDGPIVHVIIEGTLGFDKSHINVDTILEAVKEITSALYADVRFDLVNDEFRIASIDADALDRASIEREVFRKLARFDSVLAGNCDFFAASLSEVKDMAVKGADEKTLDSLFRKIYHEVKNAPVVPEAAPAPVEIVSKQLEPEMPVKPVKKPRKKAQKSGQVSLDWSEG